MPGAGRGRRYSYEEAAERDRADIPFLRELTLQNVRVAAELYGPKLVGTSKVHRLLHLYEADPQFDPRLQLWNRNDQAFRASLAHRMPPMIHVAAWVGERLHKRVKRAAFKARKQATPLVG